MNLDTFVNKPFSAGGIEYCITKNIDSLSDGNCYYICNKEETLVAKIENQDPEGFNWFVLILGHRFTGRLLFKNIVKNLITQ